MKEVNIIGKVSTALIIKFVATFAAAWVAISLIGGEAWTWALWAGILGTVLNYIIGDKMILPSMGNLVASVADGLLGAALLFLLDMLSADLRLGALSYLTFFLLVAMAEYLFHRYLMSTDIVNVHEK